MGFIGAWKVWKPPKGLIISGTITKFKIINGSDFNNVLSGSVD